MTFDTILASALASLPDAGSDGALPADIQVFPPGKGVKFTLQDYPGQEFDVDIDAATADTLNANLQTMLARAARGEGSEPFADKNHEDAERTFIPVRYFWAGEDKVKGGVRLVTDWVPFGASLVRAKAFKYFSQNFLFSKSKRKVLGLINENVGGLVNRPGFATQAAFAKAAAPSTTTEENSMTKDELDKIIAGFSAAVQPLVDRVAALEGRASKVEGNLAGATLTPKHVTDFTNTVKAAAKANGGDYMAAINECASEDPEAAHNYVLAMRKGLGPRVVKMA